MKGGPQARIRKRCGRRFVGAGHANEGNTGTGGACANICVDIWGLGDAWPAGSGGSGRKESRKRTWRGAVGRGGARRMRAEIVQQIVQAAGAYKACVATATAAPVEIFVRAMSYP